MLGGGGARNRRRPAGASPRSASPVVHLWYQSAISTTILPFPLVRRGDRDHPVATLQHLLRAHGQNIAVDGIFGPITEGAVRAVQTGNGLVVDGIVGPQTWPVVIVQVQQGSTGDAVRGVQEEFQFRNLSGDPSQGLQIDGIFGPLTDAAVRGFQQALGVSVDGIVGPITWRALVSGMLSF
jgi:peptidoglycan hydrolase-like protein with peptidoglycan-binding domain